ncbi:hypothetical protein VspSw1_116 [Vibrio phage VspSw_1]|uniref:Uncharacterized protein n=1 Tax=Vibrio phage VspSw_1 TaxID=2484249 RepID=A0A411BKQ0_9CAUD|nr:hypothetical protein HOV08_gp116 [Vibrio phage VspSw_1]QAY02184.1 hypothetical protein VspSw1_116 [Vibrio phage VspSw_1]
MFDANLRALPNGHRFFAKVVSGFKGYDVTGELHQDNIVECVMLDNSEDNCEILLVKPGLSLRETSMEMEYLLVYEGDYDGTGFIDEDSVIIANQIIRSKFK